MPSVKLKKLIQMSSDGDSKLPAPVKLASDKMMKLRNRTAKKHEFGK